MRDSVQSGTDGWGETSADSQTDVADVLLLELPAVSTEPFATKLDLELSACDATDVALAAFTVNFWFDSPSIRSNSLNVIETLIAEYRILSGWLVSVRQKSIGQSRRRSSTFATAIR